MCVWQVKWKMKYKSWKKLGKKETKNKYSLKYYYDQFNLETQWSKTQIIYTNLFPIFNFLVDMFGIDSASCSPEDGLVKYEMFLKISSSHCIRTYTFSTTNFTVPLGILSGTNPVVPWIFPFFQSVVTQMYLMSISFYAAMYPSFFGAVSSCNVSSLSVLLLIFFFLHQHHA